MYKDAQRPPPIRLVVVPDAHPIEPILRQAEAADLLVVGLSEAWGLESHLFGFRSERLVQESQKSLLIVRRHEATPAPMAASEPANQPVMAESGSPDAIA
jgi:hypothetical protein